MMSSVNYARRVLGRVRGVRPICRGLATRKVPSPRYPSNWRRDPLFQDGLITLDLFHRAVGQAYVSLPDMMLHGRWEAALEAAEATIDAIHSGLAPPHVDTEDALRWVMQAALFARLALNPSSQQLSSLVHELESRWPDKDQHVYLFARGVLSLSAQKPNVQVALDYFLRSLESHPKILILPNGSPVIPARTTTFDALLFYYIAEAYRQNNQYKECLMYADLSALCNQKWGKAWELRGKASLALRKFDQALISFRYAQSLNPDDIVAQRGIASALIASGRLEEAAQVWQAMDVLEGKSEKEQEAAEFVLLSITRAIQAASSIIGLKMTPEVAITIIPGLKRLLERREGTPNDRIELLSLTSSAYISLNQFSTALTFVNEALEIDPLNSQALRVLLSLLVQTGTKQAAQKAIIVAEDVLRRQPTDYAAKRLLAEALICVGQEEAAFKLLMQLSTARTNEDPNLQILMAKYYYSLGCYEEAMQACQALPEGPSPLSAEVLCARAMMKTEDTQHQQDGLQLLEELNKEFAHNSAVKVRLAEARFAAGRFQTVLPLLDSAEGHLDEMSVEYVDALSLRAKTLLQMERPDEAARYARRAERLHQQTSFAIAEISI